MEKILNIVDRAITTLYFKNSFTKDGRVYDIVLLLRENDWRPLSVSWWKKKEVCIIGADSNGNFYLRASDGSIRYWDHQKQSDEMIAKSVKEFIINIK